MDSEVMSAVIGGACALIGVGVGAVGTLGSARMQTRGASAQADAMLEQAKATYHAALDQARETQRAAYEQWRRGVQRDAYAAFVVALDEVERLVTQPELLDTEASGVGGRLTLAARELGAAHAAIELEGPTAVATLATSARERGAELVVHALQLAPRASALRILAAATDTSPADRESPGSPAALALAAHRALTLLREAVFHHDAGRIDQVAYDSAHESAVDALDACDLFTAQQKRALLADPSWDGALRMGRAHADVAEQLTRTRSEFISTARAHLDGMSGTVA